MDAFELHRWAKRGAIESDVAVSVLQSRLHASLDRVPDREAILVAMQRFGVVFGGIFALFFLLNVPHSFHYPIDLFVPTGCFNDFAFTILTLPALSQCRSTRHLFTHDGRQLIEIKAARFRLRIWNNSSSTPFEHIASSWTTLLMNWVAPGCCGSACPELTSQKRGIFGFGTMTAEDVSILVDLHQRGFRFEFMKDFSLYQASANVRPPVTLFNDPPSPPESDLSQHTNAIETTSGELLTSAL